MSCRQTFIEMKFVLGLFLVACCVTLTMARDLHSKVEIGDAKKVHGDVYVDEVRRQCNGSNRTFYCLKYLVVNYLHKVVADPKMGAEVRNRINIVPTFGSKAADDQKILPEQQSRAIGSVFKQMYKFAYRQLESLASTHALSWTSNTGHDITGRTKGMLEERSKKKKRSRTVVQVLMFLVLKVITVAILGIVAFIKKIILTGAFITYLGILNKNAQVVGVEHLHPHLPQSEHPVNYNWQHKGKQHGGAEGYRQHYGKQHGDAEGYRQHYGKQHGDAEGYSQHSQNYDGRDSYRHYAQEYASQDQESFQPQAERFQRRAQGYDISSTKQESRTESALPEHAM